MIVGSTSTVSLSSRPAGGVASTSVTPHALPSTPDSVGSADLPSRQVFEEQCIPAYLDEISPGRRMKALITRELYDRVISCNQGLDKAHPETANFRFWAKKSFTLVALDPIDHPERKDACWGGVRVATTDLFYDLIAEAHLETNHGGRDVTFQVLVAKWAKLPKGLVQSFINICPTCHPDQTGEYTAKAKPREPKVPRKKASNTTLPSSVVYAVARAASSDSSAGTVITTSPSLAHTPSFDRDSYSMDIDPSLSPSLDTSLASANGTEQILRGLRSYSEPVLEVERLVTREDVRGRIVSA